MNERKDVMMMYYDMRCDNTPSDIFLYFAILVVSVDIFFIYFDSPLYHQLTLCPIVNTISTNPF